MGKNMGKIKKALICLFAVFSILVTSVPVIAKTTEGSIKKVSVSNVKYGTLTLKKGQKKNLKVKVTISGNISKSVSFKSNKPKVVSVDKKGKLVAKKKGEATITITSKVNKKKKTTIKVSVGTPVSKITLNKSKISLKKGSTFTLKATINPKNATNKKVAYVSSDKNIATVSAKGKITAKGAGTVNITVIAKDGSGKKAVCKVTVKGKKSNVSISFPDFYGDELTVGKDSCIVNVKRVFSKSISGEITVSSSDKKIATVKKSIYKPDDIIIIEGKKNGKANITVSYKDEPSVKAVIKLTVGIPTSYSKIENNDIKMLVGDSQKLLYTIYPENASNKKVFWESSDKNIVSVDKNGVVTAKKTGSATISLHLADNAGYGAECSITVENKYSYEIKPILGNFNKVFLLTTDNPDPKSIRFKDASLNLREEVYLFATDNRYEDVVYEDRKKGRIKGNKYILRPNYLDFDGGELIVQIKNGYEFIDTTQKITMESNITNGYDYLIDNYTNSSMTFFEKMYAIEGALTGLNLYPKSLCDKSKKSNVLNYPAVAVSPYAEATLNDHTEIYGEADGYWFSQALYPYVFNSLGTPSFMATIAKMLEPSCEVKKGDVHFLVDITFNNETKSYGGAGEGGPHPVYKDDLTKFYSFDGTNSDFSKDITLEKLQNEILEVAQKGDETAAIYVDQLSGNTYRNTVGNSSWLRVLEEGSFGYGNGTYAYVTVGDDFSVKNKYPYSVENTWVDGRYITAWNNYQPGAKLEDYPDAPVMITNMTYIDGYDNQKTGDVSFYYDPNTKNWLASRIWGFSRFGNDIPDNLKLTKEQIQDMINKNTNINPQNGLIYDGSVAPGTKF